MRTLWLPGYGQSVEVFRHKTGGLRGRFKGMESTFLEGVVTLSEVDLASRTACHSSYTDRNVNPLSEDLPTRPTAWWVPQRFDARPELPSAGGFTGQAKYSDISVALSAVRSALAAAEAAGKPIQCLAGFSQGAKMIILYLLDCEKKGESIPKTIMSFLIFSPWKALTSDPTTEPYHNVRLDLTGRQMLVVAGRNDSLTTLEETDRLIADHFATAHSSWLRRWTHDGGHMVPHSDPEGSIGEFLQNAKS